MFRRSDSLWRFACGNVYGGGDGTLRKSADQVIQTTFEAIQNKPGGTMQKSEINKTFRHPIRSVWNFQMKTSTR